MAEREPLEFKNHKGWICKCGVSNSNKANRCWHCHSKR